MKNYVIDAKLNVSCVDEFHSTSSLFIIVCMYYTLCLLVITMHELSLTLLAASLLAVFTLIYLCDVDVAWLGAAWCGIVL